MTSTKSVFGTFIIALALGACATRKGIEFEHSPETTATESKIKIKETIAGTAAILIQVKHLPPPDKVKSGTSIYVVWARPEDGKGVVMNLGSFNPNSDLEGSMQTVTPYHKFQLSVTPEAERTAALPTTNPVLWTNVSL